MVSFLPAATPCLPLMTAPASVVLYAAEVTSVVAAPAYPPATVVVVAPVAVIEVVVVVEVVVLLLTVVPRSTWATRRKHSDKSFQLPK